MGIFGIIKGIFLTVLSFLLVLSLTTSALALNAKTKLFDSSFYIDILERTNASSQLKDLLIDIFTENFGKGAESKQLKDEISKAIPITWIKDQIDGLLRNGLDYLKGDKDKLNLTISLKEIKPNLASSMEKIMTKQLNMTNITVGNFTEPGGCKSPQECLGYCSKPENQIECSGFNLQMPNCTSLEECQAYCSEKEHEMECAGLIQVLSAGGVQEKITEKIPDSINLTEMLFKDTTQLETARNYVKTFFFAVDVLIGAVIVIVVLMILLTLNIKSTSRWLGFPFLISGILLFAASTINPASFAAKQQTFAPNIVTSIIVEIIKGLLSVQLQGILLAIAGIILLIISFFLK